MLCWCVFFCQAEDGIRGLVRSRGLGDVYKRQGDSQPVIEDAPKDVAAAAGALPAVNQPQADAEQDAAVQTIQYQVIGQTVGRQKPGQAIGEDGK